MAAHSSSPMRTALRASIAATALSLLIPTGLMAQDPIAQGKAVATAADCASCHGENFAGGAPIGSPLGDIYASNVTFDPATGIGKWTEAQFRDALRKGRSPTKGNLYPAMPYTSFTGMTDADISALYAYLKSLPPVSRKVRATDLGFPFVRPAMTVWNSLNLTEGQATGAKAAQGAVAERGRYLAEALGHCSTCHTSRGALMGEKGDRHLAGAYVGGWFAPNITPDPTGIGNWSDADLSKFLTQGHNSFAVAGGDMGLAVRRSLSKLPAADIAAIIAYLRQVPALATTAAAPIPTTPARIDVSALEKPPADWKAATSASSSDGALLYQGACASCHGMTGSGAAGPDLARNIDLRRVEPDNLVQVIAHGVRVGVGGQARLMPGFADQMGDAEIAALANYVVATFAQARSPQLDAGAVRSILDADKGAGWLIRNATWLSWVAILIVLALVGLGFARLRRKPKMSSRVG